MKFIKFIFKCYLVLFVLAVGMAIVNGFGNDSDDTSYTSNYTSNNYTTNEYTTNEYTTNEYVSNEYTTNSYTTNEYVSNEYTDNYDTDYYYVEETAAWSDTHTTAPVPEPEVRGEGYLGAFTTADGTSDIYFYEVDGQRYYYGTIYGVYCEGIAEVYESHGAIYCLDGSRNDGTVAVSFYMAYDESNEMSPYELYEQVYGTGFYWHHH